MWMILVACASAWASWAPVDCGGALPEPILKVGGRHDGRVLLLGGVDPSAIHAVRPHFLEVQQGRVLCRPAPDDMLGWAGAQPVRLADLRIEHAPLPQSGLDERGRLSGRDAFYLLVDVDGEVRTVAIQADGTPAGEPAVPEPYPEPTTKDFIAGPPPCTGVSLRRSRSRIVARVDDGSQKAKLRIPRHRRRGSLEADVLMDTNGDARAVLWSVVDDRWTVEVSQVLDLDLGSKCRAL